VPIHHDILLFTMMVALAYRSDGTQPHVINIQFQKRMKIAVRAFASHTLSRCI